MTRRPLPIPRPVVNSDWNADFCDHCGCGPWTLDGDVNGTTDGCDDSRCPCHDERFTTAIYEGATGETVLAWATPRRKW
jgi:hypothetical protein